MRRFPACLVLLVLTAGCGSFDPEGEPAPGVLVIAIDALRSDHLSSAGYDRQTTPELDRLAAEGASFASAWSTGPGILPAHVSLLTGCDPLIARRPPIVLADGSKIPPASNWGIPRQAPRLAFEFLANGWTTAAFVDHQWLGSLHGFDRGFTEYADFGGERGEGQGLSGIQGVGSRFVAWLRDRDFDEPWFAYLHMNDLDRVWQRLDTIEPCFEPRPGLEQVPPIGSSDPIYHAVPLTSWDGVQRTLGEYEALYDSALSELDGNLGRLFAFLERTGRLEATTVVVVGTFGVGFGETGLYLDSGTLSDADLHVPLLIRPARGLGVPKGLVVQATASLADIPPTLLELAGLEIPGGMHGVSFASVLHGASGYPREHAFASSAIHAGFAVMDERWCYERSQPGSRGPGPLSASWFGDDLSHREEVREVLHDRLTDPGPGHLGRQVVNPDVAARLRAAGEAWRELVMRARDVLHRERGAPEVDPAELDELRRLGLID